MTLTVFAPLRYRHCPDCDVGWDLSDGEACWICGKPGRTGTIPYLDILPPDRTLETR